jgi:hypothetical protein
MQATVELRILSGRSLGGTYACGICVDYKLSNLFYCFTNLTCLLVFIPESCMVYTPLAIV